MYVVLVCGMLVPFCWNIITKSRFSFIENVFTFYTIKEISEPIFSKTLKEIGKHQSYKMIQLNLSI